MRQRIFLPVLTFSADSLMVFAQLPFAVAYISAPVKKPKPGTESYTV